MIDVIIADDSAFLRQILKEVLEREGKIRVIGQAKNGKEAVELVKALRPHVLILDCEMPVMNGLEALNKIMAERPLPVFMFSSLTPESARITVKALESGAVDFFVKPTRLFDLASVEKALVRKIETIVIKGAAGPRLRTDWDKGFPARTLVPKRPLPENIPTREIDLIAMGSSTGGVQATSLLIPQLSASCPPIVWVQHMPEHFTKSFSERLAVVSKMKVLEAEDGDILQRGNVYLGRGGTQMRVAKAGGQMRIQLAGTERVSGFCPSCDVLFESVSYHYGENALGVILTGMGNDGLNGLRLMHEKKSYVIGQDEATCVVYGMPRAAFEAGVVDLQVSVEDIPSVIEKVCGISQKNGSGVLG